MDGLYEIARKTLVASALLSAACGTEAPTGSRSEETASQMETPSLQAGATLERLRARYALTSPELGAKRGSETTLLPSPALPPRFLASGNQLTLTFGDGTRPSEVELRLPRHADDALSLRERVSGVTLAARLRGASAIEAEIVDGYAVYADGAGAGATLLQRAYPDKIEDFIEFTARPPQASVTYELELDASVAGLRLVSNTLEALDAAGSPRLRVAPPYLVTAEGTQRAARLEVEGCAVDRDPRAPWDRAPIAPGAPRCELHVSWDDSSVSYPVLLDPGWGGAGNLATPRTGARAAVLPNGRVLVAGGVGVDGVTALASAELYNPSTRTWAATGNLSTPRADYTLTRRADGRAMAVGGTDMTVPLASAESYELNSGRWSAAASLASPRTSHQAVLLNNGDVLVAGGSVDRAERWSSRTSTWTPAGNLVSAVNGHTLTVLSDNTVLLVGGAQAQLYNPANNTWLPRAGGSGTFRKGHTATRLANGQVLIIDDQAPSAELYDPSRRAWSRPGATFVPRVGHSATLLSDGRVVVAGGTEGDAPAVLSSEIYSANFGTFGAGPALLSARRDHIDALLPSGRVLIAGGMEPTKGVIVASSEEFDPNSVAVVTNEYKFPATIDATVLDDRATELWASVTRPSTLANQRYPLLVFLHGNHGTCGSGVNPRHDFDCSYTDTGVCPSGSVVTPNHRGYDYIASELAARGFIVVSINANRGITCGSGTNDDGGLNLARGRLVLRHLQRLSEWNRGVQPTAVSLGVSLAGKLDFRQVGLLGHSRGGEGMRAAYQQYRDANSPWPARISEPLEVRGIFEIGPVDGQTSRVLNAEGTAWNVLLPACDGDVGDLEGVRPFDRMSAIFSEANRGAKSTYTVWGANHNFYNSEWQESDSGGCGNHRALFSVEAAGSAEQRQTGLRAVMSFFLANVGNTASAGNAALRNLFDPEANPTFESPVERGYTPAPAETRALEDFTRPAGTSSAGFKNVHSGVSVVHEPVTEHAPTLRAARVSWTAAGPSTYFQINLAAAGAGIDLRSYDQLDVRVGRTSDALNVEPTTTLALALVNADGSLSAEVSSSEFGSALSGPPSGPYSNPHEMLQTLRIPLSRFEGANLQAVRGLRVVFRATPTGAVHLASVRASHSTLVGSPESSALRQARVTTAAGPVTNGTATTAGANAVSLARRVSTGNAVVGLTTAKDGKSVEITLSTGTRFTPRGALLVLDVAGVRSARSQHPSGNLGEVVFSVDKAVFDAAPNGETIRVRYENGSGDSWEFGPLDKARLDK